MKRSHTRLEDEDQSESRVEESSVSRTVSMADDESSVCSSCSTSSSLSTTSLGGWCMRDIVQDPRLCKAFMTGLWPHNATFHPFYCKTWHGPCRARGLTPQMRVRVSCLGKKRMLNVHPARIARYWVTRQEPNDDPATRRYITECGNHRCINPYHDKTDPVAVPPGTTLNEINNNPIIMFIPPHTPGYTPPNDDDDNDMNYPDHVI